MNPGAKDIEFRKSKTKQVSRDENRKGGSQNKMNKIDLFSPKESSREANNVTNITD
jgi:hypothetical protein